MSEEQSLVNRILKLSAIGVLALAITLSAGALWTILLLTNLRTSPAIPWVCAPDSTPAMGVLELPQRERMAHCSVGAEAA